MILIIITFSICAICAICAILFWLYQKKINKITNSIIASKIHQKLQAEKISKPKILKNPAPDDAKAFNIHNIYKTLSPEKIISVSKKTKIPCRVMTWNVEYNLNVGTIVRTAACFAFETVYIISQRHLDRRAMVGSYHYISLIKLTTVNKQYFIENGMFPIFIEQGGIAVDKINFKNIIALYSPLVPCLVFGSEQSGIPKDLILEFPDFPTISITQLGIIKSLNVSIAAGIIMHELQKSIIASSIY
jgi:tRNA G18 (ribose-2'-O)-methylase SpoU